MAVRAIRYRRSPHLVGYWSGELTLYNYETRRANRATALAVELLDFFGAPRTVAEARRRFRRLPAREVDRAVSALARHRLLDRVEGRGRGSALDAWTSWNPAAGFFHFSTKDVGFVGADSGMEPGPSRRPPPAVKRLPKAPRVALPPAETDGPLGALLAQRRTWRRFSSVPVPLQSLATLLGSTFRLTPRRLPDGQRIHLRTSPSPGARHALEAYVLARRVEGLRPGLYHYAADRHQLERVRRHATREQLLAYLPTQDWYGDAAALVLITAVFPRLWWRYDYPRAYRAVLIEAGHFCQTFLLVATSLGLAPFCSMALADSRIERDLGVDGVTESVLYAAGVGSRPPGVDWAPVPAPKRGRMSR